MPVGAIIGLIGAGVSASAAAYGAHKQGEAADAATAANMAGTNAQVVAQQQALQYQKLKDASDRAEAAKVNAQNQANFNSTQAQNLAQWQAHQNNLNPFISAGAGANGALSSALGLPSSGGGMTAGPSKSYQPVSAFIAAALAKGTDPKTVAQQANQQFGLTTNEEATYYPGVGEKGAIGLPDSYISYNNGNWGITTRGGGSAPASTGAFSNLTQPIGGANAAGVAGPVIPGTIAPQQDAGAFAKLVPTPPLYG